MQKHVNDIDSVLWLVIDLDAREIIPLVQWADDEKGEYEVLIKDKKDKPKAETIIKKGNIKLIRK